MGQECERGHEEKYDQRERPSTGHERGGQDGSQRNRFAEHVRQVGITKQAERERDDVEQHDRRHGGDRIIPRLANDGIQQGAGDRLRAAHDHFQQGDVVVGEHRPRGGEDIQADRIRKGHPVGHRLRKVVFPAITHSKR